CFKEGSADSDPWHITSEAAINCSDATTNGFYYTSTGIYSEQVTGSTFTIPAAFPKGNNAFYLMKYEMSQEQYRDFLNLLTRQQQQSRVAVDISGTSVTNVYVLRNSPTYGPRNSIRCNATIPATGPITFYCEGWTDGNFDSSNDNQNVPVDWIGYPDLAAYSDWAGLRPMTELEYEKACRGTRPALSGEFAWGNSSIRSNGPYVFLNEGTATESISAETIGIGTGNAVCQPSLKLGRCGIFAYSSPNHTRQETGATYYGVMEMSGNLCELTVCCGTLPGYTYTGLNGNGSLTAAGDADTDYWPGINGNFNGANDVFGGTIGVTGKGGVGFKGGAYGSPSTDIAISDRSSANLMTITVGFRSAPSGIRACRTAQ
ncbi:MAG: SUMF1/EgtB/PvdO family nonheme iron enzyme, partial [Bacteroidales bacterium]